MAQYIDKSALVELRQKVQDALLKSAIDYYEAEELVVKCLFLNNGKMIERKHTMNLYGDAKTIRLLMNQTILI